MFKDRLSAFFKDLDFRWALRRSAFVVVVYLVLMYVVSQLAPGTFGPKNASQWTPILINAVIFFFAFTFIYAVLERSRRRRALQGPPRRRRPDGKKEDKREAGPLKGKPNPNMSKKKATRRRR